MSVEYFDEQRRQLIAAIDAHTEQVATRIGKTALDKQVLRAMTKVPRHEFVPVEVQSCAYKSAHSKLYSLDDSSRMSTKS